MLYTVYKTVNLLNGKFYFGVHKTENPNDEYHGSGTYIKRAVTKHGAQNFRKEVLFVYDDPEPAFAKEDELIQKYRGQDPLCKNLRKGGSGGFDWINRNGLADHAKAARISHKAHVPGFYSKIGQIGGEKTKSLPEARAKISASTRKTWTGRKHSKVTKMKMSAVASLRVGPKNSQFGTCWVTKDGENKKIHVSDLQAVRMLGWRQGRV